ncbi:WhiB family transcriptional regulator [Rhodococcus sp. WS4]|nr:WhiB family transcriptional regulator [Rhodococcus sp. WS4]
MRSCNASNSETTKSRTTQPVSSTCQASAVAVLTGAAAEGHGFLRPHTDRWDWQLEARCRSLGSETFFGIENESTGARIRREQDARTICQACPVRIVCRDHALRSGEPHGIWGGTSAVERSRLRHAQHRQSELT